jgi:opacity protein-like surface antigen
MKLRAFLVGLLLSVSATSALAAGPYIGAAGGVSIVHDSDFTVTGLGTATAEFDTGYGFNVSAGYNFDPVRLEFEFGYKNADLDKFSGPGGSFSVADTDITVMSYMVNALYDIKTKSPVTPYVGAGLGILNGELEEQGYKEDDTQFGYQLIAGAAYNINNNLALDVSYRFQHAPSDFSQDGLDVEYMSSNIMAGIRYNF